ncbi:hypothetical protein [Corynebacterium variabile]|uniref:hypothetical protein n=1 Tax=Corynebacterium variabile TaxID=1727 RepID=UPI0028AB6E67|nr:hypothetical protein [Corynebacterium variabile]
MVEQSRRVLPVRVDAWTVMDMNGPECDLGETVEFILEFREASEESEEGADRADMTVTVDAWAQEYPGAGEFDPEQMTWTTLLTGDGWSARWDAPRPVLGRVRLTGTFHRESLGPHETTVVPTRGALVRIRTLNGRRGEESRITEVDRIWKSDADRESDIRSFLVDLDLDAASRPESADLQRPCVVHGFAVTGMPGRRALWRGDVRLPLVWRTDLASGTTTPVALPMRISDAEMYLARVQGQTADPEEDACRVVTVDRNSGRRYFTVFGDGSSAEDAEKAAAPGRTEAGRIVIRYEETDSRMYTPPGGIYGWPVSSGVQHLGRADANGDVTWIREWEVGESDTTASLLTVGGQVMLWRRGAVQYLDDELEVVREARLPDGIPPEAGYSPEVSGDVLVVSGDRMLAVLDPADLSVILQVQVDARAHAQVDDNATIWVADDRLRLFTKDAAGEWTVREVEVG